MINTNKVHAGSLFESIEVSTLDGSTILLGEPEDGYWQAIFVYRGQHCPLCTKYLNEITDYIAEFEQAKVKVVAVSADSKAQLTSHLEKLEINFPIAYGLTLAQMQALGVYISHPRSAQETDHPFAEPGVFIINEKKELHVVDISNNPFVRPELSALCRGLAWIKDPDNHYPIRGTYQ
ncbi:redoxin domain-containing protein [Algicola sagamiensis]|uniref:redoxin domain-containing protein n=1 Tax=Algicola sagamiensis TaxID=163869 RepID=UPI00039BE54C|nr:redoxin domain-containing protein [Algicola sagamiensis]